MRGPYAGFVDWTFDSGLHAVPTGVAAAVPNLAVTTRVNLFGVRVTNPKTNPAALTYTLTDGAGNPVLGPTDIQPGATLVDDPPAEPLTGLKELASGAGLFAHEWGHT